MRKKIYRLPILLFSLLLSTHAWASTVRTTIKQFRQIKKTAPFFQHAYGYAVFPSVATGGFVVGGSYGKGSVFVHGKQTGTSKLISASVGFQLGGKVFSEIIFFKDSASYTTFTQGSFTFDANASATLLTLGASAEAGGGGVSATANTGALGDKATGDARYVNGMTVFVLTKGGLMYKATIAGQKFTFHPIKK